MRITRRGLLAASSAMMLAGTVPALASDMLALRGRAFGTGWRVTIPVRDDVQVIADRIAGRLAEIDRAMSPFRPDSELSAFNRTRAIGPFRASPPFAEVAVEALRVADVTDGCFDPSVGPDVGRFGFGPIRGVRAGTYRGLSVAGDAISKADAALSLDLCGIAKGYALDRVGADLEASGIADFFIEIGGEVLARGAGPSRSPWRVGIADPRTRDKVLLAMTPMGLAVATSGDAINVYEVAGRRYSHIIDPATDEPVRNAVASVSVVAPTGALADALATALTVMGPEKGLEFARKNDLPVLYLLRDGGDLIQAANEAFDALRLG